MKRKRKFSWIFRYHDIMTGVIEYRTIHSMTIDDAKWHADVFVKENKNYVVGIFRLYKKY